MNIEEVRSYALGLNKNVTEELFADDWLSFRIGRKWFVLVQLNAPEPRIAVKLPPEEAETLREEHAGISAAYHMNKRHWSDLYLEKLDSSLVEHCIDTSFGLVAGKLPKATKEALGL